MAQSIHEWCCCFTGQNIDLKLDNPTVPVLRIDELINYIINTKSNNQFADEDLGSLAKTILNDSSQEDHKGNKKERLALSRKDSILKYVVEDDQDRVLRTLRERGSSMGKSELALRVQMRLCELDAVLQELERVGKIKLTEIKGCRIGGIGGMPMIIDLLSQLPEKEAEAKSWWRFWRW